MKNIKQYGLLTLENDELKNINGGSEFTEWITRGIGWLGAAIQDSAAWNSRNHYSYSMM